MQSLYYWKDGKVVRRTYRSLSELTELQRNLEAAKTNANAPYTEEELNDRIAAAQKRFYAMETAINEAGGNAGRKRESVTLTRLHMHLVRWAGSLPNGISGGLVPLWEEYCNAKASPDMTADKIESITQEMIAEWGQYQVRLMERWKNQRKADRLLEDVTGHIKRLGDIQADDVEAEPEAVKARTEASIQAFEAQVSAAPEDQKLSLVLAELARVKQEMAATKQAQIDSRKEARTNNTVATVKNGGMEALIPTTKAEKDNIAENAGWVGPLLATIGAYLLKSGLNPVVKTGVKKLATDLYNKSVGMDFKAENRVYFEQRLAELRGQQESFEQADAEAGQARQRQGADLMARVQALRGHPHLKEDHRKRVENLIESWGLGTNRMGSTFNTLTKLVNSLERATTNPKSPAYKA